MTDFIWPASLSRNHEIIPFRQTKRVVKSDADRKRRPLVTYDYNFMSCITRHVLQYLHTEPLTTTKEISLIILYPMCLWKFSYILAWKKEDKFTSCYFLISFLYFFLKSLEIYRFPLKFHFFFLFLREFIAFPEERWSQNNSWNHCFWVSMLGSCNVNINFQNILIQNILKMVVCMAIFFTFSSCPKKLPKLKILSSKYTSLNLLPLD